MKCRTQGLKALDDLRGLLAGSQAVEIHTPDPAAARGFIARPLSRFG